VLFSSSDVALGLGLGSGLDVVFGWLVVMHTYFVLLSVVIVARPLKADFAL